MLDTVSTIPFSTARVQPLLDDKSAKNDIEVQTLENQCFAKARRIAELSAKLEGKGVFADQAQEVLESFMFRIKAFEDLALENFNEWSDEERRERAGFLLLALTTLPRAEEASCLAATDSYERFTILDNFLGKTESELSAKVALDGVFGDAAPRAPLPRSGDRISFFWTEEDGWWDCEVVERVAPGFYSVKWDVDGSITRVQLDDDNANRWRLVPRQRPPEQSERRKRGEIYLLFIQGGLIQATSKNNRRGHSGSAPRVAARNAGRATPAPRFRRNRRCCRRRSRPKGSNYNDPRSKGRTMNRTRSSISSTPWALRLP